MVRALDFDLRHRRGIPNETEDGLVACFGYRSWLLVTKAAAANRFLAAPAKRTDDNFEDIDDESS
jgi:hypothetical protein